MNLSSLPLWQRQFIHGTCSGIWYKLTLIDVSYKVMIRVPYVPEYTESLTRRYCELDIVKNSHAIAETHMPYTLYIPLDDSDIVQRDNLSRIFSVQGQKFEEHCTLFITISAQIPELDSSFVEQHSYEIPRDIEWGRAESINVDFTRKIKSKHWNWKDFDKKMQT